MGPSSWRLDGLLQLTLTNVLEAGDQMIGSEEAVHEITTSDRANASPRFFHSTIEGISRVTQHLLHLTRIHGPALTQRKIRRAVVEAENG